MNDLRTLIDVSAGTRLPQYEAEIFSDIELTKYYLRKLCEQHYWYMYDTAAPRVAYRYASDVMKCRWPEAEHIIATAPQWAMWYAETVVKSRWPEAEAVIASDPEYAYYYATRVIKSRWPEAEPVMASDHHSRKWYNNIFGTSI